MVFIKRIVRVLLACVTMLTQIASASELTLNDEKQARFYIFVSFSLSDQNLKDLLMEAAKYHATVVMRGLKNNDFKETFLAINSITEGKEDLGIVIDPELFDDFEAKSVPTFVLASEDECPSGKSCMKTDDKLIGNVSVKYVLEKFAKEGDLSEEAKKLLAVGRI